MTRSCEAFENDKILFLEDDLSPDRRALLEEHLSHCASCTEEWTSLRSAHEALLAWPLPEIPSHVRRRIQPLLRPRRVALRPALAAAAALAACAVAALLVAFSRAHRPSPRADLTSPVASWDLSPDTLREDSLSALRADFDSLANSHLRSALRSSQLSSDGPVLASDAVSFGCLDLPLTAGALRGDSFRETARGVRNLEADSWFLPSVSSSSPASDSPSSQLERPLSCGASRMS
ncbi:MAG: zf-HC2 domain-containing protein [Planctomycetota bacterium]